MTNLGVPVPPGFTISTEVCNLFYKNRGKIPKDVQKEIAANLARLEKLLGKKLGDPKNPLLVSVRSGAKFSMPGMMDTVLNLGLNDKSVAGVAQKSKNPRFAYDSSGASMMFSTRPRIDKGTSRDFDRSASA
jgi:pyruvate,orthophosphate dikinase